MRKAFVFIQLLFFSILALAGALTPAQQSALATNIRGNAAPVVVAALAARNDDAIRDFYNADSATDAWRADVDGTTLFEATPITQFDGITQGKRDAWKLMLDQARQKPLDFGRTKLRAAVRDVWATTQADAILTACTRKATVGELVFGGTVKASGTVSATDLNVEIILTTDDISTALNNF